MVQSHDFFLFDLDGTLIESHDLHYEHMAKLVNEYAPSLGFTDKTIQTDYLGINYEAFFRQIEKEFHVSFPENVRDICTERAMLDIPVKTKIIDGAIDFLRVVRDSGFEVAIVTNAEPEFVPVMLKHTNLNDFFEKNKNIFTMDMVKRGKPAPDLCQAAMACFNKSPSETLLFEDSATGVKAGIAAQVDVWGFTGVAHDKEKAEKSLLDAGASRVYDNFTRIIQAFNN